MHVLHLQGNSQEKKSSCVFLIGRNICSLSSFNKFKNLYLHNCIITGVKIANIFIRIFDANTLSLAFITDL